MIGEIDVDLLVFKTMGTREWFGQLKIVPESQYRAFNNGGMPSHLEQRTKFFNNHGYNSLVVLFREKDTFCC